MNQTKNEVKGNLKSSTKSAVRKFSEQIAGIYHNKLFVCSKLWTNREIPFYVVWKLPRGNKEIKHILTRIEVYVLDDNSSNIEIWIAFTKDHRIVFIDKDRRNTLLNLLENKGS